MPDLLLHSPGLLLLLIQAAVSLMLLLHRLLMFLLLLLWLLLLRLLEPHELGQLLPDAMLGIVHGDLVLVLQGGGEKMLSFSIQLFDPGSHQSVPQIDGLRRVRSFVGPLGRERMHGRWRGPRLEDLYGLAGLWFLRAGTERRRRLLLLLLLWRMLLQRLRSLRDYLLDGHELRFDYGSL